MRLDDVDHTKVEETNMHPSRGSSISQRYNPVGSLQTLHSYLISAQEAERKRIASDLHDDLGQSLAVLKLRIQSIKNMIPADQVGLTEAFDETVSHINQIIDHVRWLSHGLSPVFIEDLGLTNALEFLVNDHASQTRTKVSMEIEKIDRLLPTASEVAIYRVFQEVFTNIQKHSDARAVSVRVFRKGATLLFDIHDRGRGFDIRQTTKKSPHDRGLGLSSMDERIRMLGGQLTIESRIGKGTRISFSVPLA